jgi:hypothetical protein
MLIGLGSATRVLAQTTAGSLYGQVTDPSGAAVPGATVRVTPSAGGSLFSMTNQEGTYEVKNLVPGTYTLKVTAEGFGTYEARKVVISPAQVRKLDVALKIQAQVQQVEIQAERPTIDIEPENNAGAIILKDKDLQALSDDPDELQNDLEALAGPSAGPNGGQIYVDGFTAGQLPPKSAIREIRINQNPFSSEYDKLGYGRIEIFTKPGTDQLHGEITIMGNDSAFNSRNPFAVNEPSYYSHLLNASISGPLGKRASVFFTGQYRDINEVSALNAEVLDSNLTPLSFVDFVSTRRKRLNLAPRFDYQVSKNNTLNVRYQYWRNDHQNSGLTGFALPSQAYHHLEIEQTGQISDTQIFGAKIVNETRFQYIHELTTKSSVTSQPTVTVLGAFTSGGNGVQNVNDDANRYEFQNYTSIIHGKHSLRFGARLRGVTDTSYLNSGFNGNFTFPSLAAFQMFERGLGGGPTQLSLTTGTPAVSVSEFDAGPFVQDDWHLRPNFILSAGLRLELQTDINDNLDWAPRLAIAWGITRKKAPANTVLRAGVGVFYDRFAETLVLQAQRLDGITQRQIVITDPTCFSETTLPPLSSCGTASSISPTIYRISPTLHAPGTVQTAVTLERRLTKTVNLSFTYLNSRGFDQLLTKNINTPLPGTFPALPVRPLGGNENIYEYESAGIFRQHQYITQVNIRQGTRISLFGYYVLNYAKSDTAGANSFPSNPYNILQDYGRAAFDIRHRVTVGGSIGLPHAIRISLFLIATSGTPYNISISQDLIGSTIFNQRPAFAGSTSTPRDVVRTPFGAFDTVPQPGETLVPINFLTGPPHLTLNVRLSKTWGFGAPSEGSRGGRQLGDMPRGPGGGREGAGGNHGGFGVPGGIGGIGSATNKRYNLTFSVNARNIFNYTNLATPTGVLNPPSTSSGVATESHFFGMSNGLSGGAFSSTAASRVIYLQIGFSF